MKMILPLFAFIIMGSMLSCDNGDPQPVQTPLILPLRLELDDYHREFSFDTQNRVEKVKTLSFYPNDVVLESITEYFYSTDNKLEKTVSGTGYRLEYHYEGDKITRTDEYVNDEFTQFYTFTYGAEGMLQEYTTWDDIPEYGGLTPKAKEVYIYDNRGNLTDQLLYFYDSGTGGHKLLTTFEYSEYDNHVEAESLFDVHAFNPQAVFRKNNPGKMVTKNGQGTTGMIDTYRYVYDARGYVTEKTTTVSYSYNGQSGSYKSHFFYQER